MFGGRGSPGCRCEGRARRLSPALLCSAGPPGANQGCEHCHQPSQLLVRLIPVPLGLPPVLVFVPGRPLQFLPVFRPFGLLCGGALAFAWPVLRVLLLIGPLHWRGLACSKLTGMSRSLLRGEQGLEELELLANLGQVLRCLLRLRVLCHGPEQDAVCGGGNGQGTRMCKH